MSSKKNPGKYDCYKAAEREEEMFVILGRDDFGYDLVMLWIALRLHNFQDAIACLWRLVSTATTRGRSTDLAKMGEAYECAQRMKDWRRKLDKKAA